MLISIITVARNSEDTIGDTIRSVIGQTYENIEYIIVDGDSEDGTLEVIRQYENSVSKIISEPDAGVYYAMNKGISMAKGEIVGFLNADDLYVDSNVLNDIVKVFDDPAVDACYSDLVYVDKDDTNRILRHWKSGDCGAGCIQKGWIPPHPTFYVRRSAYEKYGVHDVSYKLAADYELMLRFISCHAIKLHYIDKVAVKMRLGGLTNKSLQNIVKQNVEILRACRKHAMHINFAAYLANKALMRLKQYLQRKNV